MAEAQVPEGEQQQPEKPKKKKSGSMGGVSMPLLIGGVIGVIVLIFAAVVLGGFVATKLFSPASAADSSHSKVEKKKEEKKKDAFGESVEEGVESEGNEENIELISTGRITTNPKSSTQFVVVSLGMVLLKNKETVKEEDLKPESMGMKKMIAMAKGVVNQELGSMTVEDLQMRRDSLPSVFKNKFKTFINPGNKFRVKQVILEEFIIQ